MCYNELESINQKQEIINLKQYFIKEQSKWLEERQNLLEIIDEIKSCLYVEKIHDEFDGEASSFYDT